MTRHSDPARFWAESNAQIAIVRGLRAMLPPAYRVVSFPNGRFAANPRTVARLIREGLTPGAWDLVVLRNDGEFWASMEVKAQGGKLSDEQEAWQTWLVAGGASHAVVRSLDEAVAFLEACGVALRGRVAA
jgi:hypothetical protein